MRALVVAAAVFVAAGCRGSSAPVVPTDTTAISSVALTSTSVAVGGANQGTIRLTVAAAAGGESIALSSSNPAVATVQTPVAIQAGASSATFTIAAVAVGTATITASVNGSSGQSPMLTVTTKSALASLSFASPNVVGGESATGTATLTAAAPAGGAVVSLSAGDPIVAPASVTVPAGSVSAPFDITTKFVGGTITATVSGSYGGTSASAVLFVTRPNVATASFGISGSSGTDTCTITNGGATLSCTFDGSSSSAPAGIVAWDWSYRVASAPAFVQTTSGPVLSMPAIDCTFLPPPPMPAGASSLPLTVSLTIHDSLGNTDEAIHSFARVLPVGSCGF